MSLVNVDLSSDFHVCADYALTAYKTMKNFIHELIFARSVGSTTVDSPRQSTLSIKQIPATAAAVTPLPLAVKHKLKFLMDVALLMTIGKLCGIINAKIH